MTRTRMLRSWQLVAVALLLGSSPAWAEVAFDWVTVGDPGNACDTQATGCYGSVPQSYRIATLEVTNAQYAEFLNAVATTDTNGVYYVNMGGGFGGITRSGSPGSYGYSTMNGRADMPVVYISFWAAARFANWLHNGQPVGAQDSSTTEDGAYTLTLPGTVTRNGGAQVFIPSEDEWYKAAYYDPGASVYFEYPAGSDTQTTCTVPGAIANTADCNYINGDLVDVGSYTGATSPVGTFDQGGSVGEWNDTIMGTQYRGMRGGSMVGGPGDLAASFRYANLPGSWFYNGGFRVASPAFGSGVPSLGLPGVVMLWSFLGLAGLRRLRA